MGSSPDCGILCGLALAATLSACGPRSTGAGTTGPSAGGAECRDERTCVAACRAGDADACLILGDNYARAGMLDRAGDAYGMACDLGAAEACHALVGADVGALEQGCGRDVAEDCLVLGVRMMTSAPGGALPYLQRACELHGMDACAMLGLALTELEREAEAEVALTAGCDLGEPLACGMYAERLWNSGRREEAERLYRRSCDLGLALGCRALGGLLIGADRVDEGAPLVVRGCLQDDDAIECMEAIGVLYGAGRTADAESVSRRACELGNLQGCTSQAGLLALLDRTAEAETPARTACAGGEESGCVNLTGILSRLERHDEALAVGRESCERGQPESCANASEAAMYCDDAVLAETLARRGLALIPADPVCHTNLGSALVLQGRVDEALVEYRAAVAADPGHDADIRRDATTFAERFPAAAEGFSRVREEFPEREGGDDDPRDDVRLLPMEALAAPEATAPAPEGGRILTIVPGPPESQRGPGPAVPDPDDEARSLAALRAAADGSADAARLFGSVVNVGPGLWAVVGADLGNAGIPATHWVSQGGGYERREGRVFTGEEVVALLARSAFRKACARAVNGGAHSATEAERAWFYSVNSYEFAGEPISVVGRDPDAVLVDNLDGRIFYLDLLPGR